MQSVYAVEMDVDVSSCIVAEYLEVQIHIVLWNKLYKHTKLWIENNNSWGTQCNSDKSDTWDLLQVQSDECP